MDIKNDYCSLYAICILPIDIQIVSVLSPHKYVDPHVGHAGLSALSIHKYVDAYYRCSGINASIS